MSGIGNTPRKLTVLSLEARKSFAFGLQFKMADTKDPIDLTGATVRFVMKTPKHRGGAVLIDQDATLLEPLLGLTQFELQAADLDLAEGSYPYVVTLVSALGYSTVVLKGEVDLRENADPDDSNVYASVNPSTNLAAYLYNGGLVTVEVTNVDGLYAVVSWMIENFRAEMQELVDRAEAAAELAESLSGIDTSDALVAYLVEDEGSDTRAALSATIATEVVAPIKASTVRAGYKVALLGASITYMNGDSSLQDNPGPGTWHGPVVSGIVTWANAMLGQPLNIVANVSHGGYNSAQILALVPDVIAANPEYVIGHDWWINDIVGGVSLATSQANINATITALNSAGVTVILTDYPAIAAYTTDAHVEQHWLMLDWLAARQDKGFLFVPISDSFVDPATGEPQAAMTYDGTHPLPIGARALGEVFADRIAHLFPGRSARQPMAWSTYAGSTKGNPRELIANPMPYATIGAGVAPFWAISGTGSPVSEIVAADDHPNLRWQRLTFGTDGFIAIILGVHTGAGLTYDALTLVPGTTRLRMGFEFRVPSISAVGKWVSISGYQHYTPASDTNYALQETSSIGQDTGFSPDDNLIYQALGSDALIPVGSTAVAAAIAVYGQAGAAIDIRRVSLAVAN